VLKVLLFPLSAMSRDLGDPGDSPSLRGETLVCIHCGELKSAFIRVYLRQKGFPPCLRASVVGVKFPLSAMSRDVGDPGDSFPQYHRLIAPPIFFWLNGGWVWAKIARLRAGLRTPRF